MTQEVLANGRYLLRKAVGEGGMATVYVAYDRVLDVHRAVKLLASHLCQKVQIRQRFLDEARAMARLKHINIVTVHDVGMEGENQPYIIMELIRGGSAGDLFEKCGPQTPAVAGPIVLGALQGLQVAHDMGIVHRDIKPHNILLTRQGVPKITDFGIAHIDDTDHSMTRTGAVLGTLAYMAPEQRRNTKGVGKLVDIYAAGATLFALLSNEEPFDLYAKELQDKLLIGVPGPLRDVIVRACEYEPDARYPSAAAMAQSLRDALDALNVERNPDGTVTLPVGSKTLSGSWGDEDDERLNEDSAHRTPNLVAANYTTDGFVSQAITGSSEADPVHPPMRNWRRWALSALVLMLVAVLGWRLGSPDAAPDAPVATQEPLDECGDGNRGSSEECDDGNDIETDVCTSTCELNLIFLHGSSPTGNIWWMGRDEPYSDRESASYEIPKTPVMVHPFWMQRNEVTRDSFAAFRTVHLQQENPRPDDWLEEGGGLPATHVTYDNARIYCQDLGGDLPTEAQWEYAARSGGRDIMYPWGNEEPTCELAVLGEHECSLGRPRDVCSRPAGNTAQGICDMSGNVWEWVRPAFLHHPDDEVPMYPGRPGEREGTGASESEVRKGYWEQGPFGQNIPDSKTADIIRGAGHWMTARFFNRSRARYFLDKGNSQSNVGFRCAWKQQVFPLPEKYRR